MSNHTPGPWRFDPKLGVVSQFEINDVGEPMNIAQEVNYLDGPILAAAPELLEELQYRYEQNRCGCRHPACKSCDDDQNTLKVLRKAKGETE